MTLFDKPMIILATAFFLGMLYLASGSDRTRLRVSYDQKIKIAEAALAREVKLMKEQPKNSKPKHRAERLDDGLPSDIPIQDLFKGQGGFL